MREIQIFLVILFVHYLSDFVLQTDEQAKNKGIGKNLWNRPLFFHVLTYTISWSLFFLVLPIDPLFYNIYGWLLFVIFIGVPHYLIDWCTSRIGKPFWEKGDAHNGFCIVGFDQILHYICLLFVLYGMITIID